LLKQRAISESASEWPRGRRGVLNKLAAIIATAPLLMKTDPS
jgi:hypothetical protein